MNIKQEVFSKITELAAQRVELGAAQDLEKELVNIKNLEAPIASNIDKLTNLDKLLKDEIQLSNSNMQKLNASYEKAVLLYEKLDKMQKELGIETPIGKTAITILKGAETDYNDLRSLLNKLK